MPLIVNVPYRIGASDVVNSADYAIDPAGIWPECDLEYKGRAIARRITEHLTRIGAMPISTCARVMRSETIAPPVAISLANCVARVLADVPGHAE